MSQENSYEAFRNKLMVNLCRIADATQISSILQVIDMTMSDYDLVRKSMELITTELVPNVVMEYLTSKAISHKSVGTLKQYKYKLVTFFSTVRKSYVDIEPNDIRKYLAYFKLNRNVSDRYMECIRITLNGFFEWLVDNGYMNHNPCKNVEKIYFNEKKRQPLTTYELEMFRWKTEGIREKALVDFLFSTGLRVSECASARLSDINWHERSLRVRHGKGDKERIVFFNAESEVSLREYLDSRKEADNADGIFLSERYPYKPIGSHGLEDIMRKISERSGIKVSPHRLRHTF